MGGRKLFNEGPLMDLWHEIENIRHHFDSNYDRILKKIVQGVKLDDRIYRIMSVAHLKGMCECCRISLVRPETWDDPYETALLYGNALHDHNNDLALAYRDSVCASCWSKHEECDGLWRGFARDSIPQRRCEEIRRERNDVNSYVQISSTVRNLLLSILLSDNNISGFLVCGAVEYLDKHVIDGRMRTLSVTNFYQNVDVRIVSPFDAVEALYIKRKAFEYEQEVRLAFVSGAIVQSDAGVCFETLPIGDETGRVDVPFNPQCIERVVLDPWASRDDRYFGDVVNILKTMLPSAEVSGSDLYVR